jgi:hypothetical protein
VDCRERKVGRLRRKGDGLGKVGKAGKEGLVVAEDEEQEAEKEKDEDDQDCDDDGDGCAE